MAKISWNEIQDRATEFIAKWYDYTDISSERGETQSFWSDFLSIYGVDRKRHKAYFEYAIKKNQNRQGFIDMFWPGKLLVEQKFPGRDLTAATQQAWEYLDTMPDHDLPQAIVVCDFMQLQVTNTDSRETVTFPLTDLPKQVKLFAFIIEDKSRYIAEEDPVNIKAADAMARLHNQLRDDNYVGHDLELLLVRLVFCMFADDSGIFDHHALLDYITDRTNVDGSDLGSRLNDIFETLNTPLAQRQASLDEAIVSLPYVNGGLFAERVRTPHFNGAMRRELVRAMELDWSKVSPAIFGSMFQGVMDEQQRRNLGAHYTSEKNILRVIKPLFLDELYDEFDRAAHAGPRKRYEELAKLQTKLAGLKFLDPACGSGNFLVITYRELRRLEHKIVAMLSKNAEQQDMFATAGSGIGVIKCNVDQMYGIEIEEFPSLIAQSALWLTDHQMNMEYSHQSGRIFKRLPLTVSAKIVNANALTTDWNDVVPSQELNYILGNPPFVGAAFKTKDQSSDLQVVLGDGKLLKLDFVAGWYFKATDIMQQNHKIRTALVSTNSIVQGEQVPLLWGTLFTRGIHIFFAHRTFKWSNDAKGNAAVYCTIVGFSFENMLDKRIFDYPDIKGEPVEHLAANINGYLIDAPSISIEKHTSPLSDIPHMIRGCIPYDGGSLLLSQSERDEAIQDEPEIANLIKRYGGAAEMLNNQWRYCLWLKNTSPQLIRNSPFITRRIALTKKFREEAGTTSLNDMAATPSLFGGIRQPTSDYLLFPRVSSERRRYMPIGYFSKDTIVADSAYAIPDARLYHFGILTSQMHMAWMRAVAGRLKSDYRYSKDIVYNNFVWPEATDAQKTEIEALVQAVLDARAEFPDSSLADLYNPLTMPPALVRAHRALDRAVDRLYSKSGFPDDPARVAHLFELYREKTSA